MKYLFALLSLCFVISACNDESAVPPMASLQGQEDLVGTWEYRSHEQLSDTTYASVYVKVNKIAKDKPGITFKGNGAFISKQNAGWCGTPPISYANYDGTFTINQKLITVNSTYWGGAMSYKAEVLSLTDKELRIREFDYSYQ